jgi:hypothetical protein
MQYATLEEAYPNFYPKKQGKKKEMSNENLNETFQNDYSNNADCYYDKQGLKMPTCDRFVNGNGNGNANANSNGNANANSNANSNANANGNGNGNGNANSNANSNGNANSNANANGNYNPYKERGEYIKKTCSPLQVPNYEYPVDSNSQKAYKKAIETSLLDSGSFKVDNFSIKPYDFDEYDAYLNINDINTNNKDTSPEYRTTPYLADYLKNLRDTFKKKEEKIIRVNDIEQFTNNSNNIKVDVNLYNLFLFIFIGIIIILLCDQITRLAVIVANKNI